MELLSRASVAVLLTFFALIAQADAPKVVFMFELAGGPPASTHYVVKLFDDGTLWASSEGLPINKTGLTKHEVSTKVRTQELQTIVQMAVNAHDFTNNPVNIWPDCNYAEMMVITTRERREKIVRHSGCIDDKWNQQPQTGLLLLEIEKYLPVTMRGFP